MHHTEKIIDEIVNSTCGSKNKRKRYLMCESLRNLVRLAKTEHLMEIRRNGDRLARPLGKRFSLASHATH